MTRLLHRLIDVYQSAVLDYRDARSEGWLLCASPLVPLAIIACYLYFVRRCGPRFMANRPAYDLRSIIVTYNALQVVANAYVSWQGWSTWYAELNSLTCQLVNHNVTETTELMANLVYAYYVLKIADLLDTVFFVLRKKDNQASFLHVYHHCIMVFAGYLGCRFCLNGHYVLLGTLNTLVHAVLYSYYLMTALNPSTKDVSWKKYITMLQLVQFAIFFVYFALPLLQPDCGVQKIWCAVLVVQNAFMFIMFSDFYRKAYSSRNKLK